MKKYHFITGLPRSGSTLLTSILNQNPRFHSSITDPLAVITRGLIQSFHANPGFSSEVPLEKRKKVIKSVFDAYYDNDKEVCFNTNRTWGMSTYIINEVFPQAKFIACVRDIQWILDSFELAHRRSPLYQGSMTGAHERTVYDRCDELMSPQGVVGLGYTCLKQAITGNEKNSVMLIEYDQLCKNPAGIINALYAFIDEPQFTHDFNNVEMSWDEYDAEIGIPIHQVRKRIEYKQRTCIIPPDIIGKYSNMEVWRMR